LLGTDISNDRIIDVLLSIELTVSHRDAESATFAIPSFRFDLEREVDLIEEVARLHGLDNITPVASAAAPNPLANDTPVRQVSALRNHLIHLGLQETVTYSLVSEELLNPV
jgi:phenylalanyl-tRNA synthetase beta chain